MKRTDRKVKNMIKKQHLEIDISNPNNEKKRSGYETDNAGSRQRNCEDNASTQP